MEWLDKLIARLPSLKGFAAFLYVATHWNTISHDLEEFRRQIKDREEWAEAMLKHKDELHRLEAERLHRALEEWEKLARAGVADIEAANATAKKAVGLLGNLIPASADMALLLGRLLSKEGPLLQALLVGTLNPTAQELVQRVMAQLPPADRPISLRELENISTTSLSQALRPPPLQAPARIQLPRPPGNLRSEGEDTRD